MEKKKEHSFKVRKRAFVIWQKLGYLPWRKPKEKKERKYSGEFYRGAFDSIPFLNDDAKRTFSHLLLRPGYMIRDYIKGAHERYLAPLTALIVFYAFFALVSAVLQPVQQGHAKKGSAIQLDSVQVDVKNPEEAKLISLIKGTGAVIQKGWIYLHLDQYPDEVDTQHESSIAALESTLRSQGIPLFLSQFFFLWLAMSIALRRFRQGLSATAAAAAYILCQFSFFMLFAVLSSFGKETSISILLMLVLLVWDYHQWLGTSWRKSLRLTVATGIHYGLLFVAAFVLAGGAAFLIAYLNNKP